MSNNHCYLCGTTPATVPLNLKVSFTAHCFAAVPESDCLCDRCDYSINLRAYYWNPNKNKYSLLFARGWSWLYQGSKLLSPTIEGEMDGFPIVKDLATRSQIRDWLLNPPTPPFTIAITESGQKHILFLAKQGDSQELFPVQFEMDQVWIRRSKLIGDLESFEWLYSNGASKADIVSGDYKSMALLVLAVNPLFSSHEDRIDGLRGTRYLELLAHVAQKYEVRSDVIPTPVAEEEAVKIKPENKPQQLCQLPAHF